MSKSLADRNEILTFDLSVPVKPQSDPPAVSAKKKTAMTTPEPAPQTARLLPPAEPLPLPAHPPLAAMAPAFSEQIAQRDTAELRQAYAAEVWRHVAHFKPRGARLSGTAMVAIEIAADGSLVSVALTRSSGSGRLDRLAIETASRAAPYPPPPADLDTSDRRFIIPFEFR